MDDVVDGGAGRDGAAVRTAAEGARHGRARDSVASVECIRPVVEAVHQRHPAPPDRLERGVCVLAAERRRGIANGHVEAIQAGLLPLGGAQARPAGPYIARHV